MISSPSLYDPVQNPRARARSGATSCSTRMLEEEMITRPEYDEARAEELPVAESINPPAPESDQPYFSSWLTQQLVDRYGAGRGVRRRARHQDHPGPGAPGGRRGRDLAEPDRHRPQRLARGDREQDRRGEGDGRRLGLRGEAVQPRHERPPPARLRLQAVHPDRRPPRRGEHRADLRVACRRCSRAELRRQGEVRGPQLRGPVLGRRLALHRHGELRQLRLRRARPGRGHEEDRAACAGDGHRDRHLDQPGDDARRPDRGRHAARDGLRLQHDRQRRRSRVGHAGLARERPGGLREGRRRRDRQGEREVVENRVFPSEVAGDAKALLEGVDPERERARTPRSASSPRARPAPPRTTATPGSSASTRS